jgi:hypothetical protein
LLASFRFGNYSVISVCGNAFNDTQNVKSPIQNQPDAFAVTVSRPPRTSDKRAI